jgi:hypothetical protein
MPKAHEIATELRKMADGLDAQPEANLPQPTVYWYCDTKPEFIASVPFIPRPLNKREDKDGPESMRRIRLDYNVPSIRITTSVYKSLTCELVEPAKPAVYRCDPILSALEEVALEVGV